MSQERASSDAGAGERTGLFFALGAYGMWGFLPAYYKLTVDVQPDLIVAQRIVWSVILVALFLLVMRRLGEVRDILKTPRLAGLLCLSSIFIAANWLIFIWAINAGRVLDVSLGYFINPLVSILVGLVILREQLTRLQTVAVGLASVGVAIQAVLAGGLPWVSLGLAFSFAAYGYVRKVVPVRATPGLLVETLILLPLAAGYLLLNVSLGKDVFFLDTPVVTMALIGSGFVTAVPLILFSAGARRLPMVLIGILQYIAPSIHFIMAVFVWGEPLNTLTLTTFVVIWCALAVFSFDSLTRWRRGRRLMPSQSSG